MDSERNGIIDKWIRQKSLIDLFVIVLASIVVFLLASRHDLLETIENYSRQHEKWELDELITVAIFLVFSAVVFGIRRWVEIKRINTILKQKIEDLRKASAEIKQLKEIIPICSNCKNLDSAMFSPRHHQEPRDSIISSVIEDEFR